MNNTPFDWEKFELSVIRGLTYLALTTPLIVSSRFFFPYVVPKTIFFRLIIDLIAAVYIFLVLRNRRYLPRINVLTIVLAVFIGVYFFASLFGVNFERSFWSNFERMTGLLTMLHLLVFFLILTAVFRKREDWEKLFTFSIAVTVLVSFYFLFSRQQAGLAATLGNTTFMSGLLLFNIFFALMLSFNKKASWRIFYILSFLVIAAALMLSTCQAAIASFWLGLFLFLLGWFFWQKKNSFKKSLLILSLLLGLATILLVGTGFSQKIFKDISQEPTFRSRLILWNIVWQGWQERPWLGWGPENFNVVFSRHFDPRLFLREYGGQHWFDRSHNIIFDTLTETGLLGFLSYLAIFGFAVFVLLKNFLKTEEPQEALFSLGMIVVLLTYFAQNLFVFDMISTYLMFFLCLGFINFLISGDKGTKETKETKEIKPKKMGSILSLVGAVLFIAIVLFVLYWGDAKPGLASYYTLQGIGLPPPEAGPYFQKAMRSAISKTETPEQLARRLFRARITTKEDKEVLKNIYPQAIDLLKKVVQERPLNFRLRLVLGESYYRLYLLKPEKEYLEKSQKVLQEAVALSPKNQEGYWQLSQLQLLQGNQKAALTSLEKAIALEPRLALSHWYLARAYLQIGDLALAKGKLLEAEKLGYNWQGSSFDLKQGIKIYQGLKDYSRAVALCQQGLKTWPKDMGLWIMLVKTYKHAGREDKAQETINFLKATFLNFNVEEFLDTSP